MCQLLGMNCNVPTDICFSFTGFQARGGKTDIHKDGWGIAFFEGNGARLFLDPKSSIDSKIAEFVKTYPIHSKNVIAHIRKATQGQISLENTHPFSRELWGRTWVFAHNGNIIGFNAQLNGSFLPIGNTDSELVFCWILQELRLSFGNSFPENTVLMDKLADLSIKIGSFGEFNFLLSNGKSMFAHCSTRLHYIIRKAPFKRARLKDQDVEIDFSAVTTSKDQVVVIVTDPLTDDEVWTHVAAGTLLHFEEGELIKSSLTIAGPQKK